ncbi:MAG: hypothetical protein WD802_10750 [Gemmatimonadaceae bacterium]
MIKLRWFAVFVGLLAVYSCASPERVVVAQPGVPFLLLVGERAALNGSNLLFKRVSQDSRCPANAICVWEGDAEIEVTASREGGTAETRTLSLSRPGNEVRVGDLFVRFLGLDPYPGTYDPSTPQAYRARLEIRKL